MDADEIQIILLLIAQLLLLFSTINQPLLNQNIVLIQRLLPGFRGSGFNGRDVFSLIANQPWLFWRNTGETTDSLLQIVSDVSPNLLRLTRDGRQRQRLRLSQHH